MHQTVEALLMVKDINVDAKCEAGNTALHMAFMIKDFELISQLIKAGGKCDVINMEKKTPY